MGISTSLDDLEKKKFSYSSRELTITRWSKNGNNNIDNPPVLIITKLIEDDQIPEWLTTGVTFLIPKNENTENPKNYRPVICLPTINKLITSLISRRIQKYTDDENLMPKEQKGCCSGSEGCKDQLLISKEILQKCRCRKKICVWHGLNNRKLSTGRHTVGQSSP